jgi:hypothetical protein
MKDKNGFGKEKISLDIELIKKKYSEGFSCKSIADIFSVSPQTIHRRLISKNVNMRKGEFEKGHKIIPGVEKGWFKSNNSFKKIYLSKRVNGKKEKLHRIIMEKYIGRKLKSKEVVHHIDGNPKNNSIKNLKLFKNQSEHMRHHIFLEN